jgi:cell division protein FtsQ
MTQVLDPELARKGDDEDAVAIDPRILQRRQEVTRQRSRRRWKMAGAVAVVVVVVGGVWAALHSSVLAARQVTVVGAIHTGDAPVVAAVGLNGQPLVDVNPGQVAARVEALPWVAHATVTRHWPDDITVVVTERVPVAAVAGAGGGTMIVDARGRVLAAMASAPPGLVTLVAPVVPGRPGSVLGPGAAPGLAALAAVPASLDGRVQQASVGADGDVTLALSGNLAVTMGPAVELGAKFEALTSVLVDVAPRGPADIDVTVPDAPAVGPPLPPPTSAVPPSHPVTTPTVGQPSTAPQLRRARPRPS